MDDFIKPNKLESALNSPLGSPTDFLKEEAEGLQGINSGNRSDSRDEPSDVRILNSLRRIVRATELYSHRLATEYKITSPQLVCLHTIKSHGPLTATLLAKKVYLSPSTIVGIIDRLEQKKLVRRERDQKDRRNIHLHLTEQGEQLILKAPSLLQDRLASALKALPELEQVSISLALEKIVSLMELQDFSATPLLNPEELSS